MAWLFAKAPYHVLRFLQQEPSRQLSVNQVSLSKHLGYLSTSTVHSDISSEPQVTIHPTMNSMYQLVYSSDR